MTHDEAVAGGCPGDAGWHGATTDFAARMSYGDYLGLDRILDAQHPRSPEHDEMLFIVQHQTTELWMKLVLHELHELHAASARVAADDVPPALKMLARVSRILEQLAHAWSVLATLTPPEYSAIRPHLAESSGFQSYQYREIEFVLGNKAAALLAPHAHRADLHARLQAALRAPSLYDEAIRLMARQGLPIDAARLSRDPTLPTERDESVQAAWTEVYRDPQHHWALYELAEKLVDIEDAFRQWRFRHLTTVERVIGFKRGTGGTEGAGYLRRMLQVVLFPELWQLRTGL